MSLTREEIERLRELERAATPGPWRKTPNTLAHVDSDHPEQKCRVAQCGDYTDTELRRFCGERWNADAALIAAARNALPSLLDAAERYSAALEPFHYLLNRMENAALAANPAQHGYAAARQAVLAHVAQLVDRCAAAEAERDRAATNIELLRQGREKYLAERDRLAAELEQMRAYHEKHRPLTWEAVEGYTRRVAAELEQARRERDGWEREARDLRSVVSFSVDGGKHNALMKQARSETRQWAAEQVRAEKGHALFAWVLLALDHLADRIERGPEDPA